MTSTAESSVAPDVIFIRRWGNTVQLSTLFGRGRVPEGRLRRDLEEALSYTSKEYLTHAQRRQAGTKSKVVLQRKALYAYDDRGRMNVPLGLLDKTKEILSDANRPFMYADLTPGPEADGGDYTVDRDAVLRKFVYKARQDVAMESIFCSDHGGSVEAPTGFGKMALIVMTCVGLPYARIDVVTKRVALVENLVDYLKKYLGGHAVGQVGGGRKVKASRVNVYTADSLHLSPADADVLLVDEAHELMADRYAERLARYTRARRFAFTASPSGRFDGKDARLEALFGRPLFVLKYKEAVSLGLVVPIEVQWLKTPDSWPDPCPKTGNDYRDEDETRKKRLCIWTNEKRNKLFADKALSFGDAQVLILADTVEHLAHLKPHLPGYTPVFASCEEKAIKEYVARGVDIGDVNGEWLSMNKQKRRELKKRYESGELRHVMATGVWAVGVDFTHLQVLARADGGSSEIASIQLPGRVARVNASIGKEVGILLDCEDRFNASCRRKAETRGSHYENMEWEQMRL